MSELLKAIGHKVRAVRIEQNITIEELAKRSGMTKSYVWQMEQGDVNISVNKLEALCNALQIEVGNLFQADASLMAIIDLSSNKQLIVEIINYCLEIKEERDLRLVISLLRGML